MKVVAVSLVAILAALEGLTFGLILAGLSHNSLTYSHYIQAVLVGVGFVTIAVFFRGTATWVISLSYCLPLYFLGGMIPLLDHETGRSSRAIACAFGLTLFTLLAQWAFNRTGRKKRKSTT